MERATIAIRRVLQKDFPQLDQRQLNLMIIPKMKQVEVEITLKNNDVCSDRTLYFSSYYVYCFVELQSHSKRDT